MTEGTFITFYSYKGGVGRTLALANVATLLSSWGYRVLCVDWDLEAPGLHLYFRDGLEDRARRQGPGLVDLVEAYVGGEEPVWQQYVTPIRIAAHGIALDFLHAGRHDESYVGRMQALDWEELYERHDFGEFLEGFREEALRSYDFVLIDSRTGVTDIGGICTVQLPDFLVVLFTANEQSFDGALEVLNLVERQRDRLPFDRASLAVLPIISRWESRFEYELAQQWLRKFEKKLANVLEVWLPGKVTPRELLRHLRIPYFPYWSFGERLAVLEKGTEDPDDIGFSFETLAALLAQRLAGSDLLALGRRTALVSSARRRPEIGAEAKAPSGESAKQPFSVFISYSHKDESLLNELENHLALFKREGFISTWDNRRIEAGESWRSRIDAALEAADLILLLVSPNFIASDYAWDVEMKRALQRHSTGEARVLPIIVRPVEWASSPLGELQAVPSDGRPVTSWANRDEAWLHVARGIRRIFEQSRIRKKRSRR